MVNEKKRHLKKRPDGRYATKYHGIFFYGATEAEAINAREAYKAAELLNIQHPSSAPTVYEYALKWLPVHKASVSKATYNSYANYVQTLVQDLGDKPMDQVSPTDIKEVYNHFLNSSDSAIKKAQMLYRDIWDTAIEDRIVTVNPCRSKSAHPHKGTVGTHRALTKEEDELLLWAPARFSLGALTMRYAGLRRGEIMALDIDRDVDFKRKIITVREAVRFEGNAGVIVDPKTKAGKREVPLLKILEDRMKGQHGPIVQTKSGKTVTSSAWRATWDHYIAELESYLNNCSGIRWYHLTKDWIKDHPKEYIKYQLLKKKDPAKAEELRLSSWKHVTIRPHDLRHSFCTMCRDNDVDIKLCIKWMGHADEKMILKIYDHENDDRAKKAVKRMNKNIR